VSVAQFPFVAPAHLWVPEHTSTSGAEAADFAETCGIVLDPEQRLALDSLLAEKPNGKWSAFEACLVAARQNLKTFVFEVVVLADLYLFDSQLVVWTAHEFDTATESFLHMKELIDTFPHLSSRVKKVSNANGDEGIEFHGGQRLRFKARTKVGGRGITGDRVILDEAFLLTRSMMGTIMPIMSARSVTGNPQILYGSSAGKAEADVLRGLRDRGRAGGDPGLVWVEWCAPVVPCADERCFHDAGTPGCTLDDQEQWRKANPSMGRRISVEWIASERRTMSADEFARERLGWWEEPASSVAGLPLPLWDAATSSVPPGTVLAYGVDVTPDFSHAAIARATAVPDGILLDLAAHRRGTSWVAEEMSTLRSETMTPVALDLGSPASVLADDFRCFGIETVNPSARDVAQACSGLLDGLIRHRVWHASNPALDSAVKGASRRPMGEAWAWSRKNSLVDISPMVAITLALWGAGQSNPDVALNIW